MVSLVDRFLLFANDPSEENFVIIKQLIRSSTANQDLEQWNNASNSMDLVQMLIVCNSPELIRLLFYNGAFCDKQFPRSRCSQYIHLASRLGRYAILQILIEFRQENIMVKSCTCLADNNSAGHVENSTRNTSLDLAAMYSHPRILNYLIDKYTHNLKSISNPLEGVIKLNSAVGLEFLIEKNSLTSIGILTNSFTAEDMKAALKQAILQKRADCVLSLLDHDIQPDAHCLTYLFLHSDGFSDDISNPYVGVYKTTCCLLQHPKSRITVQLQNNLPNGRYPLYCLLTSLLNWLNSEVTAPPQEHIDTLNFLLTEKANPNFNEIEYSQNVHASEYPILSREPYVSALHSFFILLDRPQNDFHVTHVLELLLNFGANPYQMYESLPPITAIFRSPSMIYSALEYNKDVLCKYLQLYASVMSHSTFYESMNIIINLVLVKSDHNPMYQYHTDAGDLESDNSFLFTDILNTKAYVTEPFPLQRLCKLNIWKATGWKRDSVLSITNSPLLFNYLSNLLA